MPSTDWVGSPGITEKAVKASTLTSRRVAASRASRLRVVMNPALDGFTFYSTYVLDMSTIGYR